MYCKRTSGCGAGIEYIAVTPEGDVYPCHQFIGKKDFCMGNVTTKKLANQMVDKFKTNHLHKEICNSCWARYYCGGGCHANAYDYNNSISIPYKNGCAMHKKRIEGAIYLELKKK